MAEARYTRLPAACRREREQEQQAARAFERWYDAGVQGPWFDVRVPEFGDPCGFWSPFSHLYDAKETPCS